MSSSASSSDSGTLILGLDISGIGWLDIVLGGSGCRRLPRQQSSAKRAARWARRAWPFRRLLGTAFRNMAGDLFRS